LTRTGLELLLRRLLFASAIVSTAWLACWVLDAESSPLNQYFLWHPAARNAWGTANLAAVFLGFAISGNVHAPSFAGYLLGVTIQWGAIGFLASLAILRRSRSSAPQNNEMHPARSAPARNRGPRR
jgi:hypothetical protein